MSKLAIDGGPPVHDNTARPWPGWPPNTEESWARQQTAFREIYLSATEGLPGPRARRFEKAYSTYLGTQYGLMTTSGTSALKLALGGVTDTDGLGDNGECLIPNYTFIASITAALEMGFSVRMVDVDLESGCMDPAATEAAITPRTRVIMPVDILGHPADMDALVAIARKHKLKVVEDACQAHGAEYKGRKCGSLGDAGCFSFQSTKNLTSGEGGFVATDDVEVYKRAHAIHNVGRPPEGMSFDEPHVGYNYRPSEYLASLLEERLKTMDADMERRTRAAAYLDKELKGITGVRPAVIPNWVTRHARHLYLMRYEPSGFGGKPRDEFIRAMNAEGIPVSAGYTGLVSRFPVAQAVRKRHPELIIEQSCPNTEKLCSTSLWLTQNILLADERTLADIPEAIRKLQKAFHA